MKAEPLKPTFSSKIQAITIQSIHKQAKMILLLLFALILPAAILIVIHRHKTPASPPGPPGLPFIGNLHQFDASAPHVYLWRLSKKYGPLMSMKLGSKPVIVVSSPKMAKEVLKNHDLAFCSRPSFFGLDKLSFGRLDIAFAPYSESWRELRKISVLHLLSSKQVQSFRPVREEEVSRLIRKLSPIAKSEQVSNLRVTLMALTSRLICRVAFGKSFDEGGLEKMRFDELMTESQAIMAGLFISDYMPLFGWVDKVSGMIDKLEKVLKDMDEFYKEIIDDHLDATREKSGNTNILDLLIQLKEGNSCPIDLTWDHIKAILMNLFIAGTDTTSAAITWTMTALMKNPTIMKKLQNEIRDLIGSKGIVDEDDLSKLPYLKAVIKESLRLYPPAPLILPRETLEKCTLESYTIQPKTLVYVNAWAIARDPESWEHPNEFIPERFLNTKVDILGQDFHVIPFGSGRRGCPGITMGLDAVELALANLVYSFDWELPNGVKTEDIDEEVLPGITMHKKNPLCLVPKKYECCP